jgi:hypothetical protein
MTMHLVSSSIPFQLQVPSGDILLFPGEWSTRKVVLEKTKWPFKNKKLLIHDLNTYFSWRNRSVLTRDLWLRVGSGLSLHLVLFYSWYFAIRCLTDKSFMSSRWRMGHLCSLCDFLFLPYILCLECTLTLAVISFLMLAPNMVSLLPSFCSRVTWLCI